MWGQLLFELVSELWHEHKRARARRKVAEAWANTPAPRRGCSSCLELAYTPGQTHCHRCGAELTLRPQ